MKKNLVYKMWMKQLFVKLLQRMDYDQHYKFFIHENSIGIVTNFNSNSHEPLYVCSCGESEWNINIHQQKFYQQEEIWDKMNLNDQIIFHNGANFLIFARQFLRNLFKKYGIK